MGKKRPFVGLRSTTEVRAAKSISQMAAYYVDAILRYQPTGPFYLCGYSFGATIAYEMAVQLLRQGNKVGRLTIIDQRRPGRRLTARNALAASHRILAHIPRQLHTELSLIPAADRFRHVQRKLLLWSKAALGQPDDGLLRSYKPTVGSVPITLFRANVQRLSVALDSTLGWRDLVKGQVRVCVLPGDHVSIMREPLVQQLAKMISDDLDVAQGVSDHFKGLTSTDLP
jgi:thioesterase domain-containing protein